MIAPNQYKKFLESYEFKSKVFNESTPFYSTSFNYGLKATCDVPETSLRNLVEYGSDSEEVKYSPDDLSILKVCHSTQSVLSRSIVEFDQEAIR